MEAVELAAQARLLMKTVTVDISFKLQHLKHISEFSEALFPTHLQNGHCVNCVPNGSWVLCSEVFKAKGSEEESSDKCAAVIYAWNKELHINVRLNQDMRLIILRNIHWHI